MEIIRLREDFMKDDGSIRVTRYIPYAKVKNPTKKNKSFVTKAYYVADSFLYYCTNTINATAAESEEDVKEEEEIELKEE
jgi:hypothetical protein